MELGQAEKILLPSWKLGLSTIEQGDMFDLFDLSFTVPPLVPPFLLLVEATPFVQQKSDFFFLRLIEVLIHILQPSDTAAPQQPSRNDEKSANDGAQLPPLGLALALKNQ